MCTVHTVCTVLFIYFYFPDLSSDLDWNIFPWRNKLNGAAQGGEYDLLLWWGSVVYITSRKRTVRLGLLLGLYESFLIKSKSGSSSHTGGSVQGRAALLYSMYFPPCLQQIYSTIELSSSWRGLKIPDFRCISDFAFYELFRSRRYPKLISAFSLIFKVFNIW